MGASMTRTTIIIATALAFAAVLPAAPAQAAARDRVFVASYGSDSNPCTFGSPCKTFQQAVSVVAVNGEVTAIDSAGFGPINIAQSVTITSPNGVEAGIQAAAGGDAITISAPGATVTLRGLTLEGAGVARNGIVLNSGGSLTVTDCVVQNFHFDGSSTTTGNAILIEPIAGTLNFIITNTITSNNGLVGIYYYVPSGAPTTTGVIDHVVASNNDAGVSAVTGLANGGSAAITISNSILSNNDGQGAYATNLGNSTPLKFSIDNAIVNGNGTGIDVSGTTNALLGRSFVTANTTGIMNNTSNTFYSFQNNEIGLNGSDVSGALNKTMYTLQ
jgi:hypothetical protein